MSTGGDVGFGTAAIPVSETMNPNEPVSQRLPQAPVIQQPSAPGKKPESKSPAFSPSDSLPSTISGKHEGGHVKKCKSKKHREAAAITLEGQNCDEPPMKVVKVIKTVIFKNC